jgi:hypothetical protein
MPPGQHRIIDGHMTDGSAPHDDFIAAEVDFLQMKA